MKDKVTDIVRTGIVSSINPEKCMARVTFEDRSNTVSGELFVTTPFTLEDKAYYMPAIGERVLVVFDPSAPSKGYIMGSFFSDKRKPPITDGKKAYLMFEDNTLIEYDKKEHTLTVSIPKTSNASLVIKTEGNIHIESKGDLTLKGKTSSMTL